MQRDKCKTNANEPGQLVNLVIHSGRGQEGAVFQERTERGGKGKSFTSFC